MAADATGAELLRDKPRLNDALLASCASLPADSFGSAYHAFMTQRGFSADARPGVRFVACEGRAYAATRAREAHDLWHVLFGCPTDVAGELALKAVEAVALGLPSAGVAALVAPLRLSPRRRAHFLRHSLPWALRAGASAGDLMCIRYEDALHEPLSEVRARWRILPFPADSANEDAK